MEAGRIDVPLLSLRPSTSATKFARNLVNHAHIKRIAHAVKVNVCTLYYCPEPCWDGGMSTATKTYSHTDKQALHVRFRYPKEALHVRFPTHRHMYIRKTGFVLENWHVKRIAQTHVQYAQQALHARFRYPKAHVTAK